MRLIGRRRFAILGCLFAGTGVAQTNGRRIPPNMYPVKPVSAGAPTAAASNLRIARGQYFNYALPQGWRVGEDGQFALTLVAPDSKAITVMVGNAGVPINYPPAQHVYERLMAIQPQNLQLGPPQPARPIAGFAQAMEFTVRYSINGVPCQ